MWVRISHKWTGVLIGSPSVLFSFRVQTLHSSRAFSERSSTGRASCSCGTSPFIREASPAADVDGSHTITVSMPCRARESGACPQRRHALQVGVWHTQLMRATSFDQLCDIRRHGRGISLNEQMDMIRLDGQFDNRPSVFIRYLFDDLLETIMHRPIQYLAPPLGAKDDRVQNMMHRMLFMDVSFVTHVYGYISNNRGCQHIPPAPLQ